MKNLKKTLKPFFKRFLPIFIILFICCGFFWRVFVFKEVPLPGDFIVGVYYPWLDYKWGYPVGVPVKNPIMADVVSFSYPMRILATNLLKNYTLPLWNPLILNGTPLLANFQSAPFSPTIILYFIFNNLTAWSLQIILQHIFAAVFMYLLLRHWKASKAGSVLGGIIFAFSGFNLIWSQWNAHTLVASFIPLLIYFTNRFLVEKKIIFGVGISIALFFQMLSGYPQLVIYTLMCLGILFLFRIFSLKQKIRISVLFAFFIALGFGLASFQLLPSFELLKLSQRSVEPHPYEWAFLPYSKIITFISSEFFGNHVTRNYWGPQDYTSNTGYVGIIGFVLAIISLDKIRKNKEILYCFIIILLSLVLSFPTVISIFFWKSGILGFNAAAAHRALVLFTFGIAMAAGFGYDRVKFKINSRVRLFAILIPFVILFVFGVWALKIHNLVAVKGLILPILVLAFAVLAIFLKRKSLLIFLAIIELFYFGWKFTPFTSINLIFPETPVISFLKNQPLPVRTTGDHVIPINLRMPYGIETVEGYDAIYPESSAKFVAKINNDNSGVSRRYAIVDNDISSLLDIANTKYYIALKSDPNIKRFDQKRFLTAFQDKSVVIFESKFVKPRAFLLNGNGDVSYKKYEPLISILSVDAKKDDILFISDTWYPGWRVFLNGQEKLIMKSDLGFREIEIPKGKYEVKMVYEPESFSNGLKISVLSLIFLIGLGLSYQLYLRKFV